MSSRLEEQLAIQFRAVGLQPKREFRFHDERKWRFDFAFEDVKLAVEVEGGIWNGGAHTRGAHFRSDCEKYNAATEAGWRVLRYTDREIKTGAAIAQIARLHYALSFPLDKLKATRDAWEAGGNPSVAWKSDERYVGE